MKFIKITVSFALILTMTNLFSCGEEDASSNVVVDKIDYHEDLDDIGEFEYDSEGKILTYNYRVNNILLYYTDYTYSNNQLIARTLYEKGATGYTVYISDVYTYGTDGNLETVVIDREGSPEKTYTFTWDNEQMVRMDSRYTLSGIEYHDYYEIEYDSRGNTSHVSYFSIVEDQTVLNYITDYEYDDKTNPLFKFGHATEFTLRNPNNMTKETTRMTPQSEPYSVTTITYTYNEFELPGTKHIEYNVDNDITEQEVKISYKKI